MKIDAKKTEEGLPEIAEQFRKKKPMIFAMIGIISIATIGMFFTGKSHKKVAQPIEETYAVQQGTPAEAKSQLTQTQVNTNEQPSPDKVALAQEQLAMIKQKQNELQQRLAAPLMLVNNSAQQNKVEAPAQTDTPASDRNTEFLNQASSQSVTTVTATKIGPLNSIVGEGTMIHAILEPATNSDLPGDVRAVVSEPCYSEDGTQILIPRGSRLLGQYKSGMLQGQSRIFMVWTRLLTPSGISIQIGSPGVDSLGSAGMGADEINRHFWARFGTASLLSIIGTGAANAGVSGADQDNSASAYRTAMANSFSQSADQSLEQDGRIPPTLITYQGKPIMIFVAKDLNFQDAMKQVNPSINLF